MEPVPQFSLAFPVAWSEILRMGCDAMKNLIAWFLARFGGQDRSAALHADISAGFGMTGALRLSHLTAAALLAVALLGFSPPVKGQTVDATLLGTVTDSSGAAVANVKLTITEMNTGIVRTSQTNESGNYVVPDLPPGTYSVTAELSGFKRESRPAIDVIVNTSQRIDMVLQPGNVSETVTVEAETPILH